MVTSSCGLIASPNAAYAAHDTATTTSAGVSQAYESWFQTDNVMDINVTIDDADWESMLESPLDKDYKKVSVEVDGHKLDNVGFSTKGNMTLKSVASMEDSDRYSRLKFDKYDKTQTLLGLDKMVLNNNYADPSYMLQMERHHHPGRKAQLPQMQHRIQEIPRHVLVVTLAVAEVWAPWQQDR